MSESFPAKAGTQRVGMVRSSVALVSDYKKYKPILRKDCWFACSYCTLTETEAAGVGFEIDHYDPSLEDRNNYGNLFWSCALCNGYKGDFWALDARVRAAGYRVLRIDQEHPSVHLELDGLLLNHRTQVGKTSIKMLRLNRLNLRDLREARRDLSMGEGLIMSGVRDLFDIALDDLAPASRAYLLEVRERVRRKVVVMSEAIEDVVEHIGRSAHIDDDPGAEDARRVAREHLNEVNALGPELTTHRRAQRKLGAAAPNLRRREKRKRR